MKNEGKKQSKMSLAASKAWETRRQKYGSSGLRKKPEEKAEKTGAKSGGKEYFCDYCGAGPFEESWQKATHVKVCKNAKESRVKQV